MIFVHQKRIVHGVCKSRLSYLEMKSTRLIQIMIQGLIVNSQFQKLCIMLSVTPSQIQVWAVNNVAEPCDQCADCTSFWLAMDAFSDSTWRSTFFSFTPLINSFICLNCLRFIYVCLKKLLKSLFNSVNASPTVPKISTFQFYHYFAIGSTLQLRQEYWGKIDQFYLCM